MFTGIISDIGIVDTIQVPQPNMRRFVIKTRYDVTKIDIGASVAHDGCCLTIVEKWQEGANNLYSVDVSEHSLDYTKLGEWDIGTEINLERALQVGDELGGHIVSGHVDGVAVISNITRDGECSNFTITPPERLLPFIAEKGSVTLEGTSLTVTWVRDADFGLTLIPHSLHVTNWGKKAIGDKLNIEIDVLARYMQRILQFKK
jgi:riboflavin synthase